MLAAAKAYAEKTVSAAVASGEQLLAKAAAEGAVEAAQAGPAAAPAPEERAKLQAAEAAKASNEAAAAAAKESADKAAAAAKEAEAAKQLAAAQAEQERVRLLRATLPFKSAKLPADKRGVFGGLMLGASMEESLPAAVRVLPAAMSNSALYKQDPLAPKRNIYGRKKSCLKDIAAHFDEKDIYEAKKTSLLQLQARAESREEAETVTKKLENLETWHAMMQKKFLMTNSQAQAHESTLR